MHTYIVLLRGINVGGKHILPMKALRSLLEGLDLLDVRSYIQSGNVVFKSAREDVSQLRSDIGAVIAEAYGFEPAVLLLTSDDMQAAIDANPYPEGEAEPTRLNLFFLASPPPDPDLPALEALRADDEQYALRGAVFYLHAPAGIGRSKLAAKIEKSLGVPTTARNWRSVTKIMAMAQA